MVKKADGTVDRRTVIDKRNPNKGRYVIKVKDAQEMIKRLEGKTAIVRKKGAD